MAAKAIEHRKLRFNAVEDALAEVERIVAAEQVGKLRRSGTWTTGQVFGHVAAWINYAYEGYPLGKPPWLIRVILKFKLKQYLRDGMPTGVRIPRGPAEGTWGTEVLSTEEGARRLRDALRRLGREPAKFPSPAFGDMTEEQRVQLNLRHTELHLGFLHY